MPATTAERSQSGGLVLLCLASWVVPGAGHLWLGRRQKGLVFLVALPLMFAIGLALEGRLFPFQLADMLVCLEAGAVILDAFDRPLVVIEHAARRTPVAAASQVLLGEIIAARRSFE